jgi:hypothetical protein
MKSKLAYKGFNPTDYVVALHNPRNTPLISPLPFMLGRWRAVRLGQKRRFLDDRLTAELPNDFEPVLDVRRTMVEVKEGRKTARRRRHPYSLNRGELEHNLKRWTERDFHDASMMTRGGDQIFQDVRPQQQYGGEIWLAGKVRRRGSPTKRDRFVEIAIAGPFESSRVRFADVVAAGDTEFLWAKKKHGYANAHYLSLEAAAQLFYARYTQEAIDNLPEVQGRRGIRIWLPFHSFEPQYHPGISARTMSRSRMPLKHLMVDTLVAYLTRGKKTKYDLNSALLRVPVIYDPILMEDIQKGDASFVPIAESWVFDRSADKVPTAQRNWYGEMNRRLENMGYRRSLAAMENKGTEFEAYAIEYINKNDSNKIMRLMFFDGLPPLVVERVLDPRYRTEVFRQENEEPATPAHPFAMLMKPTTTWDDRRRRFTASEVTLAPPFGYVPEEMVADYHAAIAEFFPGGIRRFRGQVMARQNMIKGFPLKQDMNASLALHIAKYKA